MGIVEVNLLSDTNGVIKTNIYNLIDGSEALVNPRVKVIKATIPNTFYPIRLGSQSLDRDTTNLVQLNTSVDSGISARIPNGYYANVIDLMDAVILALNTAAPSVTFSYTYDAVTGAITLTVDSGTWNFLNLEAKTQDNFNQDNLWYMLGFPRVYGVGPAAASQTGIGPAVVTLDQGIFIHATLGSSVSNIETHKILDSAVSTAISYVPINCDFGQQINYLASESLSEWVNLNSLHITIEIKLRNLMGSDVNLNGKFWVCTLGIAFD